MKKFLKLNIIIFSFLFLSSCKKCNNNKPQMINPSSSKEVGELLNSIIYTNLEQNYSYRFSYESNEKSSKKNYRQETSLSISGIISVNIENDYITFDIDKKQQIYSVTPTFSGKEKSEEYISTSLIRTFETETNELLEYVYINEQNYNKNSQTSVETRTLTTNYDSAFSKADLLLYLENIMKTKGIGFIDYSYDDSYITIVESTINFQTTIVIELKDNMIKSLKVTKDTASSTFTLNIDIIKYKTINKPNDYELYEK